MSRPRLLLCCENYAPSVGGVQEVMRQLAERFVQAGCDVTVLTSSHPGRGPSAGDGSQEWWHHGVRVRSFAIRGNAVRGMHGPVAEYQRFLQSNAFDALLIKAAQQWTFDAAVPVLAGVSARRFFIPCGFSGLADARAGGVYAPYYAQMPQWLALFDGLIFYAHDYQDIAFARAHGLAHIHHIPNGVDPAEFGTPAPTARIREDLGIPAGHDVLLTVGSQIAAKGLWEVVRAFGQSRLPRPATLVVNCNRPHGSLWVRTKRLLKHARTGRWPLAWLAAWYSLRNPQQRIVVCDLPRPALVQLYQTARLFVLASHQEYSPLVLFEAAAAACAFLASDAGNSREIAQWTQAGVVVPRQSAHSAEREVAVWGQHIAQLLNDPERLDALGARGREAIFAQGFTWDVIAQRYLQLLLGPARGADALAPTEALPQVSWLLCTHQDHALLHRAIASCLQQTLAEFELLLVVNGPQAATLAPALRARYASEARVRVLETPVHQLNFSLSLGLHAARAPLIARIDADDVAAPDRLQRQVACMQRNPALLVLGSAYRLIDAQGQDHGSVVLPQTDAAIRRALRYGNPFCHPSVMLRRAAVCAVGGYLGGQHAEDYDLWVRLAQCPGGVFGNLEEPLLAYNVDPSGPARRSRAAYANVAATQWRQWLLSGDPRWWLGALLSQLKLVLRARKG